MILALSSIPSLHPVSDHTHHYLLSSSFDQSWPTGAVNCVPWRPATAASPFCVLSQPHLHPSSFSALFLQRNSSSCPSLSAKQNWLCLGAHHSSPPPPPSCHIGSLAGLRKIASRQIIQPQPEKSQINGPFSADLMVLPSTCPGDSASLRDYMDTAISF